jgi:hypothetical protein
MDPLLVRPCCLEPSHTPAGGNGAADGPGTREAEERPPLLRSEPVERPGLIVEQRHVFPLQLQH